MTTIDKPSIAELQRRFEENPTDEQPAMPVLLEIVAAVLVANSTACDCHNKSWCTEGCSAMRACRAFEAALSKVRP